VKLKDVVYGWVGGDDGTSGRGLAICNAGLVSRVHQDWIARESESRQTFRSRSSGV